jgi:hypothetical protein
MRVRKGLLRSIKPAKPEPEVLVQIGDQEPVLFKPGMEFVCNGEWDSSQSDYVYEGRPDKKPT